MPGRIKDLTFPDGVTRKVEEIDFSIVKEDWNEYQLTSGGYLKLKSIVQKIFWVLDQDGNRLYNDDGDPFILVRSSNQVTSSE